MQNRALHTAVMLLALAGLGTSPVATNPSASHALSKEQLAAAEEMVTQAQAARDDISKVAAIRPQTPELVQLRLGWPRRVLQAQLLLHSEAPEQQKLIETYVKETSDVAAALERRVNIDLTQAALHMARHAVAEAEALQAGVPLATHAVGIIPPSGKWSPEQRTVIERMVQEAQAAIAGINDLENIRARTPEFQQLKVDWLRVLLDDQCLLDSGEAAQQKAMDVYATAIGNILKDAERRVEIDATNASLHAPRFYVTEANFMRTSTNATTTDVHSTPLSNEQYAILVKMLTEAQDTFKGIQEIENIRQRTSEFFELKMRWLRTIRDTELLLGPSVAQQTKAIDAELKQLDQTYQDELHRTDNEGHNYPPLLYQRAEAKFVKASLTARKN